MVYRQKSTKNKLITPKKILFLSVIILLVFGGFFGYRHFSSKSKTDKPATTSQQQQEQKIDLTPPTQEDTEAVNQHKDEISKNNQSTSSQNSGQKSVSIVVVDASQYDQQIEVRAFVSGVVENGGTCTYVFTNSTTTLTKQTKAAADATTTRCPTLNISRSEFSAGNWSVTVSYKSTTAQGTSTAKSFEVK